MAEQAIKIYNLIEAAPEAIVVHCSDPRFQRAFAEFIQNELALRSGSYIPLAISGGVGSLAEPLKLPKEFRFMKERLRMFFCEYSLYGVAQHILSAQTHCSSAFLSS